MTQLPSLPATPKVAEKEYLLITAPLQPDNIEEALETKVSNLLMLGWVCSGGPIVLHEQISGKADGYETDLTIHVRLAQAMIRE